MLLDIATPHFLNLLTMRREGEVKLGERVFCATDNDWLTTLRNSPASFALIGIPEDIGVRANGGIGGAHTLWPAALKSILNMQSTPALSGEEIFIIGAVDCTEWMLASEEMDEAGLRKLVEELDEQISVLIEVVVLAGKIPIVVGGGHNNAYPLLKGSSNALGRAINCINLDSHSDYRVAEGRHSGNGFRYAWLDGFLERYAVVGLHEAYNHPDILAGFNADPTLHCSLFDDIFVRETVSFKDAVKAALAHTDGVLRGVELDMDCIQGVLASAATPVGVSPVQARQYLHWGCVHGATAYVHITEGAVALRDGRTDALIAKLAAYLVTDAMKPLKG